MGLSRHILPLLLLVLYRGVDVSFLEQKENRETGSRVWGWLVNGVEARLTDEDEPSDRVSDAERENELKGASPCSGWYGLFGIRRLAERTRDSGSDRLTAN